MATLSRPSSREPPPHFSFPVHLPGEERKDDLLCSRVKGRAIRDVAKIIFTLKILISWWMRADLTTPGPELEP